MSEQHEAPRSGLRPPSRESHDGLTTELQHGQTPRTPFLALSGVSLIVGSFVAIVAVAALLAYYLS